MIVCFFGRVYKKKERYRNIKHSSGATAAAHIRRLDEQAEIIVFERTGYVSYANCGLPYYVGGVIRDSEDRLFGKQRD